MRYGITPCVMRSSWHGKAKTRAFVERWEPMPERIRKSFLELFWYEREEFLADYVDEHGQNTFIRPNQIIAWARCPTACSARA